MQISAEKKLHTIYVFLKIYTRYKKENEKEKKKEV